MKGLPRRIRLRRRQSDPDPQEAQPTMVAAPAEAPAAEALPAGLAPEDVAPTRLSFRDRGQLRRRLRYLRRVRELGFRDLGGLVFDLHRFARRNDELVLGKLAALDAVDRELRAIERVLDERRDVIELREPGIAACPRCGAVHGSDARYCPQCGTQFSGPLAMGDFGAAQPGPVAPATHVTPAVAPGAPVAAPATAPLPDATAPAPAAPASDAPPAAPAAPATEATPAPEPVAPAATPEPFTPGDQPTVAMAPVNGGAAAPAPADRPEDPGHEAPPITSGDPLAPPDRREA